MGILNGMRSHTEAGRRESVLVAVRSGEVQCFSITTEHRLNKVIYILERRRPVLYLSPNSGINQETPCSSSPSGGWDDNWLWCCWAAELGGLILGYIVAWESYGIPKHPPPHLSLLGYHSTPNQNRLRYHSTPHLSHPVANNTRNRL